MEYVLTELSPRDAYRPMSAERLNLAMKLWAYRVAKGMSLVTDKDTDACFIEKVNLCLENGKVLRSSFSWLEYDSSIKLQQAVDSFLRWLTDCGNPVYLRTDGSRLCLWEVAVNSYAMYE